MDVLTENLITNRNKIYMIKKIVKIKKRDNAKLTSRAEEVTGYRGGRGGGWLGRRGAGEE